MIKKILFSFTLITNCISHAMEPNRKEQLLAAARNGNLELVKKLVTIDKVPVYCRSGTQTTPLMLAASYGHRKICEFLLDSGADIEAKDKYNNTPLIYANHKCFDVFTLLLKRGANVNARTLRNQTSLFYAAGALNPKICLLLLEHGANPRVQTSHFSETPLIELGKMAGTNAEKRTETCFQILNYLHNRNQAIITTLLCLHRINQDPPNSKTKMVSDVLYRQFTKLLLPYLGEYIPIISLLEMRDYRGLRASAHFHIDLLNPQTVFEALKAESARRNPIARKRGSWLSNCTIQ